MTTGTATTTTNATEGEITSQDDVVDNHHPGEEYYQKAMKAFQNIIMEKEQLEERKSQEQYEAMERASQRQREFEETNKDNVTAPLSSSNDVTVEKSGIADNTNKKKNRNAGVAVIKTISRQTRQQNRRKKNEADDKEKEARKWLETAAFQYLFPQALVRLGNEALEEANNSKTCANFDTTTSEMTPLQVELGSLSSIQRAMKLYQTAGENNSAEGWFNLGHVLWMGHNSDGNINTKEDIVPINRDDALTAFHRAIELGDGDSMYFVGVQYLNEYESLLLSSSSDSDTTAQTQKEAIQKAQQGYNLISSAANLHHHGGALHYLTLLHYNGHEGIDIHPCDNAEFKRRLSLAADTGDGDALFLQSHSYYHGTDGYKVDYAKALEGFVKAARDAGNADAAVSAGVMLHKGGYNGQVERDQRRAFELYQLAGELGSKDGWRNVVACYVTGEGVPRCERTAKYIAETMLNDEDE